MSNRLRVYVASKFERKAEVRAAHQLLRDAGHAVTHDWTTEDASDVLPRDLYPFLMKCAEKDVQGVLDADAILLLDHEGDMMRGAYVEFGIAIARGKMLVVVGASAERWTKQPIFYRLPDVMHFTTVEAAVRALSEVV